MFIIRKVAESGIFRGKKGRLSWKSGSSRRKRGNVRLIRGSLSGKRENLILPDLKEGRKGFWE